MQNNPHNRIMIAAPHSGSGKTLITCGLLQALLDSGKSVAAFKCGPDYIDPLFHERVLGVPSKNLDLYFTDEKTTRGLFLAENENERFRKYNEQLLLGTKKAELLSELREGTIHSQENVCDF